MESLATTVKILARPLVGEQWELVFLDLLHILFCYIQDVQSITGKRYNSAGTCGSLGFSPQDCVRLGVK